jgi:hypothetical protein
VLTSSQMQLELWHQRCEVATAFATQPHVVGRWPLTYARRCAAFLSARAARMNQSMKPPPEPGVLEWDAGQLKGEAV